MRRTRGRCVGFYRLAANTRHSFHAWVLGMIFVLHFGETRPLAAPRAGGRAWRGAVAWWLTGCLAGLRVSWLRGRLGGRLSAWLSDGLRRLVAVCEGGACGRLPGVVDARGLSLCMSALRCVRRTVWHESLAAGPPGGLPGALATWLAGGGQLD